MEAIFTTGLSHSMVPSSISAEFFIRLLPEEDRETTGVYEKNGIFYAKCKKKMMDVWIMI